MLIAIVDDIAKERKLLIGYITNHLKKCNIHADFLEYESGEAFLKASKAQTFHVVFLDIYMGHLNGIDTAKEFRKYNKDCLLIFTTTSTDHALEGFQVRAMHYLVKPYSGHDISDLMDEILVRIPAPEKYIEVTINGSLIQIPYKDIVYAEHFSHMIHIHLASQTVLVTRQSFGDFTTPLQSDARFFICSRGVIVNLEYVVDFDGTAFVLADQEHILVSRKLIKTARQTFMDFLFQRGLLNAYHVTTDTGTYYYHSRHAFSLPAGKILYHKQYPDFDSIPYNHLCSGWRNLLSLEPFHRMDSFSSAALPFSVLSQDAPYLHLEICQCISRSLCCLCLCKQLIQSSQCTVNESGKTGSRKFS